MNGPVTPSDALTAADFADFDMELLEILVGTDAAALPEMGASDGEFLGPC